jgi:hypothetical protein
VFFLKRLTRGEIYQLGNNWQDGGHEGWKQFASELSGLPHRNRCLGFPFLRACFLNVVSHDDIHLFSSIDCVIMGMTKYKPGFGCLAHTALGGGRLALFGSGGFYSWPTRLTDLQSCWMDSRKVDKRLCFDDSGGRGSDVLVYDPSLSLSFNRDLSFKEQCGPTSQPLLVPPFTKSDTALGCPTPRMGTFLPSFLICTSLN